ncbi:type I polyketide synthase [Streptomyces sp. NPDC050610]|uniref:type I polyketide synthase n=1 Tax=Streptomyces sp. NPDC050610 TaxID=3157097 RepID=UPI00341FF245
MSQEPVAVIGAGCRFPGRADSPAALWNMLCEGTDTVGEVPEDRWSVSDLADLEPETFERVRRGCFLESDVGAFDPASFGISPEEAAWVDPQHRLFLEVTWEAFEHAGIRLAGLSGSRTGVFAGVYSDDYLLRIRPQPQELNAYYGLTNMHGTLAGRVSYLWNLRGPSLAVDTSCSSSLVAAHLACQSLHRGESDLAVVGGVQLLLSPEFTVAEARIEMLSPHGRCRSFDADADGFVRGEGCGVLILKRLADAQRDGDRVLAVLRGSAVNQDGQSTRLTAPSQAAQEQVFRQALEVAGVDAAEVGMVEAHGPGTPVGDPVEFGSTAAVYGQGRDRCALGSIKSNIGHTEPASGVAGLLKAILAVRHGQVPPSLHFGSWNPQMSPEGTRLFVPQEVTDWPVTSGRRLAAVSSYGVGGTNAQVIVEEPPAPALPAAEGTDESLSGEDRADRPEVFVLSAGSDAALAASAGRVADWLEDGGRSAPPLDVAHTLALRRTPGRHRLAAVAAKPQELATALRAHAQGEEAENVVAGQAAAEAGPGPVWVFSGQGSQWARMGHSLLGSDAAFTASVEELEPLIAAETGLSLREALADRQVVEGFARVQPVLFAMQVSLAAMWRAHGVEPAAVIGHSMGEIAAAVVAGALPLRDGVAIVCRRSRLVARTADGGAMASVQLGQDETAAALAAAGADGVNIAVHASPGSTVIAGDRDQVEELVRGWEESGVPAARVAVDVASHSPQMDPVLESIRTELPELSPAAPAVGFYSTVREDPRAVPAFDTAYWVDNLRRPVRFADAVAAAVEDGHRLFIEVSPHPVVLTTVQQNLSSAAAEAVVLPTLRRDEDERRVFAAQLGRVHCAGHPVDWSRCYGQGQLVEVPPTTWEREHYLLEPTRVAGAHDSAGEHPLLGAHLADPDGEGLRWWQPRLSPSQLPWLADHRVEDVPVFPATGYCESALAAACALYEAEPAQVRVTDVRLRAVLRVADDAPVTATATPRSPDHARWNLVTRDDSGMRTTHATAALRRTGQDAEAVVRPAPADLPGLRESHLTPLEVEEFYATLRGHGVEHGPAFAALRSLHLDAGSTSALAEITLPDEARPASSRMHWHPVVFDACLQTLAAAWTASGKHGGGLSLPTAIGEVRVHDATGSGRYCLARLEEADADGCTGSVQWLAADGTVLADATGVRFARSDARGDREMFNSRLLEAQWPEAPLPQEPLEASGRWLLVTEDGPDPRATGLAERLHQHGAECDTLACGLDLTAEQQTALFTRTLAQQPQWRGVVVLPGAARTEVDTLTLEQSEARVRRLAMLCKALADAEVDDPPRLWSFTAGAQQILDADVVDLHHSGLQGLIRVLGYEHPELAPASVDIDAHTTPDQLAAEVLTGPRSEDEVAWRDGRRYGARLCKAPLTEDERQTRSVRFGRDGFALDIRRPGDLASFEMVSRPRREPGEDEIQIQVLASSLNFIDTLIAMGIYPTEDPALGELMLPGREPTMELTGMECAGVITAVGSGVHRHRVGERVVAPMLGFGGAHASFVTVPQDWAFALPDDMDTATGAALPTVYVTAWYGLVHLAGLREGESVLIHAATGGVGLAAVHIARARGARVLATAGTPAKRDYLRSLGVETVFDSRSLDFADQVRQATGRHGVDVVLNSLAGPAQKASVDLLAPQGRFVEVGKKDIYNDTRLGLYPFRRNITFHSVDLALLCHVDLGLVHRLATEVLDEISAGRLPVLPCTAFPVDDAETAFRTLANAEHIGKVVLTWPEDGTATAVLPPEEIPLARPDGSYIITGGLGGLGLLITAHLAERGAGHIVLNSRREPSPYARQVLDPLREAGTRVTVVTGDIAEEDVAERLVAAATDGGYVLRGVLHGAAVVEDITVDRFDPRILHRVWRPKALGAWRLHQATRQHTPDWWVGFSSIASLFGAPGQGSYAAASSWLDEFLTWRTAQGHVETKGINWGIWSEYGRGVALEQRGYASIPPAEGVAAFEYLLAHARRRTGYAPTSFTDWLASFSALAGNSFFADLMDDAHDGASADASLLRTLRTADEAAERYEVLGAHITEELGTILRRDPAAIGPTTTLSSLGLDSLMALELRVRLERTLQAAIPRIVIWTSPTVEALVENILTNLNDHLGR